LVKPHYIGAYLPLFSYCTPPIQIQNSGRDSLYFGSNKLSYHRCRPSSYVVVNTWLIRYKWYSKHM